MRARAFLAAALGALAPLVGSLAVPPPPAAAAAPAQSRADRIRDVADRIAAAWPARQTRDGFFVDPVSGRRARGYGVIMLGHGLLQAGARRDDADLVAAGVRAVSTALTKPLAERGVFDLYAVAAAYRFGRARLGDAAPFRRARPRWEAYLRTIGDPKLDPSIEACIASPGCFHNHEAVEAAGDVELLRTGLSSTAPGAKLADPAGTRADARALVGEELPGALDGAGRSSGPGPRRGLGVVSDANTYPLAYDALSTAMLADAVLALGAAAPPAALRAQRTTTEALAAFLGPDGDVAFLGRRQQQSWAVAAAVLAGEAGAATFAENAGAAGRFRALATRALARLDAVHGIGAAGVNVVPRFRESRRGGFAGLDFTNTVVWNGLTVFLLARAAEAAERGDRAMRGGSPAGGGPVAADREGGYFVDPGPPGFATVRRRDVWFAVNARPLPPDLRYDFGLIALKRRAPGGGWRDLIRPRPLTDAPPDSAGPVIVRGGRAWLPYGRTIAVRGGAVEVRGGWRTASGGDLGREAVFRYAAVPGGGRVTFPVAPGDTVRMRTFLPAAAARRGRRGAVLDATSIATLRPGRARARLEGRYSSCCDARLVAATQELTASRAGRLAYVVRDRAGGAAELGAIAGVGVELLTGD